MENHNDEREVEFVPKPRRGKDMNISKKIIVGYAVVLTLLVIAVVTGYYIFQAVNDNYSRTINKEQPEIHNLDHLKLLLMQEITDYRAIFMYPDDKEKYIQNIKMYDTEYAAIMENLSKSILSEAYYKEEQSGLKEIENLKSSYDEKLANALAIVQRGNLTEALVMETKEVQPAERELLNKIKVFVMIKLMLYNKSSLKFVRR